MEDHKAEITQNNLPKLINNVDNHLLVKIVDHAEGLNIYAKDSISKLQEGLKIKAQDGEKAASLKESAQKTLDVILSAEFKDKIKNMKGADIQSEYDISDEEKQAVFEYARYLYDTGDYKAAEESLSSYVRSCKSNHFLSCYWGLLDIYILTQNKKKSQDTYKELSSFITKEKTQEAEKIAAKNMLLNTSLFLFDKSSPKFVLNSFRDNEHVLGSGSIHLLRYYIVVALLSHNFDVLSGSILPLIKSDSYRYRDAFTCFVEKLLEDFDYEGSLKLIPEMQGVCKFDYFLSDCQAEIGQAAEQLVVSTFAMIYSHDDVRKFIETHKKSANDVSAFVSHEGTSGNLIERLGEVSKAQVQLKDSLNQLFEKAE
jgi:hypothetical protein